MIRSVVSFIAWMSTPFIALAAADEGGWTRFVVALIFVSVLGTILVRSLRTESRESHDHYRP